MSDALPDGFRLCRNSASQGEVLAHLARCDADFSPPLSARVALGEYAARLLVRAERVEVWRTGDGALAGLLAVYCNAPDRGEAFITSMSVNPGCRGMGLGRALLQEGLAVAAAAGFARAALRVAVTAEAARRTYARAAFVESVREGGELTLTRSLRGAAPGLASPLDFSPRGG